MSSYTKQPQMSPILVLFLGVLVASAASILIRFAQREVASLVIAAYRLSIATLILLPIMLRSNREEFLHLKRRQVGLILLSGIFLSVHFATWISSLQYTTVASAAVLVSTSPLWVAILSPIFLKEHLTRLAIAGMLIALVGGILVGISEACSIGAGGLTCPPLAEFFRGQAMLGNLLALAGAMTASAYLLVGRWLRSRLSLIVYITTVYGVAAVALVVMALVSRSPMTGFSWMPYLAFVGLAVGPQLLGHTSINYGLRHLSASFVSVALLGEPIGSTILAMLLLKETPSGLEVLGGLIILAGIYLASRDQKPAEQPEPAAQQA
jgi:drug/metabolite transporter (DMT)-like permease